MLPKVTFHIFCFVVENFWSEQNVPSGSYSISRTELCDHFIEKGDPQLWFKNAVMYKIDKIGLCNLQLFEFLNIGKGK